MVLRLCEDFDGDDTIDNVGCSPILMANSVQGVKMHREVFPVIALLMVSLLLLMGCGLGQPDYTFPPPPSGTEREPSSPQGAVVAEDSFILPPDPRLLLNPSQETLQECSEMLGELEEISSRYGEYDPCYYGRLESHIGCGRYFNYFYLQKGERVKLVVRAPVPIAGTAAHASEVEEYKSCEWDGWFAVAVGECPQQGLCELRRADDNWEMEMTFVAENTAKNLLWIVNSATDTVWCQYAVILQ